MSKFYFDLENIDGGGDEDGVELEADANVCVEALNLLLDLEREARVKRQARSVSVRDENRRVIFHGELKLTGYFVGQERRQAG